VWCPPDSGILNPGTILRTQYLRAELIVDYVIKAVNEMPPFWEHIVEYVLYPLLLFLGGRLIWRWHRRSKLKRRLSALASHKLEQRLRKGLPRQSAGILANPLASATPHWDDWADDSGSASGYLVEHPRQADVHEALLERVDAEGASLKTIVGASATGKTVLALGVGRALRSARRPRDVYVVRTPDAVQASRRWRDDLADACELAGLEGRPKPLLILEDLHLDWVEARKLTTDCESDERLRDLQVLATCRPLPGTVNEPGVRTWYDALPKHEIGSQEEYIELTEAIARRVCEHSASQASLTTLEWEQIRDKLDRWRSFTERSILEWVVLLAGLTERGDGVQVDRGLLLDHVLKGLSLPTTSLYSDIQTLRSDHDHEPHVPLGVVALLSAPQEVSVPSRFLEEVVGTPRVMLEAFVAAGLLVATDVAGETFVALPHPGVAKLVAEALTTQPNAQSVEKDVRACFTSAQVPDSSTLSHLVWSAYLRWIGATGQMHAFGDLCANMSLGYQRSPNMKLAPGILYTVRPELIIGPLTDEDRTSSPARGDGMPIPLTRVEYQPSGGFGPKSASPQTVLEWVGQRLGELLFAVYSSTQGRQRAGAALILARASASGVLAPLAHDLVHNDSAGVRFAAAWAIGHCQHRGGSAALVHALREDASRIVRATSAWALGEIRTGDAPAVGILIEGLDDEDQWVAAECAWSLGIIGSVSALPRLLVLWAKWDLHDDRGNAAWIASEHLADDLSDDALREMADADDETTALGAHWLLFRRGHTDSADVIADYLDSELREVRAGAMAAIALDDSIRVDTDDVLSKLYDADVDTRRFAARVVANRRLGEAIPSLIGLVSDEDATVRYATARALGACGEPEHRALLCDLVDDTEEDLLGRPVSEAAKRAIVQIDSRARC